MTFGYIDEQQTTFSKQKASFSFTIFPTPFNTGYLRFFIPGEFGRVGVFFRSIYKRIIPLLFSLQFSPFIFSNFFLRLFAGSLAAHILLQMRRF
jgi:hypothetical protein